MHHLGGKGYTYLTAKLCSSSCSRYVRCLRRRFWARSGVLGSRVYIFLWYRSTWLLRCLWKMHYIYAKNDMAEWWEGRHLHHLMILQRTNHSCHYPIHCHRLLHCRHQSLRGRSLTLVCLGNGPTTSQELVQMHVVHDSREENGAEIQHNGVSQFQGSAGLILHKVYEYTSI